MSNDGTAERYAPLRQHHAELESERPTAQPERSVPELSPEQIRQQGVLENRAELWRDMNGEDAERSPDAIAADQRTLGKSLPPEIERQELNDNWRREDAEEQMRQSRQGSNEKQISTAERWVQGTQPENRGAATMPTPDETRTPDRDR